MVEAWRKLLDGVAAPAKLVKRAEEERRVERVKEEEEEMKKRKVQEEKKPICSECSKEQSNKRYNDVTLESTVSPHLGKMEGSRETETGKKKLESGGVLLPSPSSELATRQEVGTTQTTTEVNL